MKFIIKNRKTPVVHPDEKTEQYLEAHPWPPKNTSPERYRASEAWRRSDLPGISPEKKNHSSTIPMAIPSE